MSIRKWRIAVIDDRKQSNPPDPPQVVSELEGLGVIECIDKYSSIEKTLTALGITKPKKINGIWESTSNWLKRFETITHKWDIIFLDKVMAAPKGLKQSEMGGFTLFPLLQEKYYYREFKETPIIHAFSMNSSTNINCLEGMIFVLVQGKDIMGEPTEATIAEYLNEKAFQVLSKAGRYTLQTIFEYLNSNDWDKTFSLAKFKWNLKTLFPYWFKIKKTDWIANRIKKIISGMSLCLDYEIIYKHLDGLANKDLFHLPGESVSYKNLLLPRAFLENVDDILNKDIKSNYIKYKINQDGRENICQLDKTFVKDILNTLNKHISTKIVWTKEDARKLKGKFRLNIGEHTKEARNLYFKKKRFVLSGKDNGDVYIYISNNIVNKMIKEIRRALKIDKRKTINIRYITDIQKGSSVLKHCLIGFQQGKSISKANVGKASMIKGNIRGIVEAYGIYGRLIMTYLDKDTATVMARDIMSKEDVSLISLGYSNVPENCLLWEFPIGKEV